tara:strand:+ start:2676 stop:3128 length:453 start_codon:yes stop_codon:yes gene_type:complete
MKKISKLNDVAFHLLNKVNKKKLKINTLLINNWEQIFGQDQSHIKIKKISLLKQTDSLNLEFKIDSSKSFEFHSKQREIILKCEEILGIKVNKVLFFQDFLSDKIETETVKRKRSLKKLKGVNNQKLNDIKDKEVKAIFENIIHKINENN